MSAATPVLVVGAGQAGLSVSYGLMQKQIGHRVLERYRLASSWRTERWDSFCLVTPNWQCKLPGFPYAGADPQGFMVKSEIVAYLENYARSFEPPLEEGVEVRSVERPSPLGPFVVETSNGTLTADQVVVATGGYHTPSVPRCASELPPGVASIHSAHYRGPEFTPDGDVLVVGTGQSGCQIAEDLHLAGRRVHLAVGSAPRCARRYRGRDVVEWLHEMGYYDIPIDRHPNREQVRDKTNHYVTGRDGGRDIDLRRFAREGMVLYGPLEGISSGSARFSQTLKKNLDDADDVYRSINRSIDEYIARERIDAPFEASYVPSWQPEIEPTQLDLVHENIRSAIWCTGFSVDFSWIHLPVLDARGHPRHVRGVTDVPGLYFLGLPWQFTWGSGRFSGVGRDADYLVQRIVENQGQAASHDASIAFPGGAVARAP